MTKGQRDKLRDYISGLNELKDSVYFPIGVVIFDEEDRSGVASYLKEDGVLVTETDKVNVGAVMSALISSIKNKEIAALNISDKISPDIIRHLRNLSENKIDASVQWLTGQTISDSALKKGKLVILMNKDEYDRFSMPNIISSACALWNLK